MKNYFSHLQIVFFASLFFIPFFSACNFSSKSDLQNENDSTNLVLASELVDTQLPFIDDNFSKLTFPLQMDSVNLEGKQKLSTDFILKLDKMVKEEEKRYTLRLPSFIKLNQLPKGQDILESGKFDIGETVKLDYYDMGAAFLKDENVWLAFIGLEYESYPACPWSNGKQIVACSFDKNGNFIDLATIIENSEGADAPVWGKTDIKVVSQNGKIYDLDIKNTNGEYGDEGQPDIQETQLSTQKISLQTNGKFKVEEPIKK